MATFSNTAQPGGTLNLNIPDINQIFRNPGADTGIYVRTANGFYSADRSLLPSGTDFNSLPVFSTAELNQSAGVNFLGKTTDQSIFQNLAPQTSGNITQSVSPINPNGVVQTDAQGNVLSQSPAPFTGINAPGVNNVQYSPDQLAVIAAYQKGNPGTPVPQSLLNATGVTKVATPQAPAANTPIGSSTMNTGTSLNYQPASTTGTYPVGTLPTTDTTVTPQPLGQYGQQGQDLINQLMGLNTQEAGKSAFATQQNELAGVNSIQASIADYTGQLNRLKAEAAAVDPRMRQGAAERGVTMPLLSAQETTALRANAVESLQYAALIDAMQGSLSSAQSKANAAVEALYGPIESQITALTNNLNLILNSPAYSAEQKATADQQLRIQQAKQDVLDQAKSKTQDVYKIAINAAANTSSFVPSGQFQTATQALDYIKAMTDPVQAQQLASQLFPDKTQATETWSAPYMLGGDYVQKSSTTGQIRTAVNMPVGAGSNSGGNIINPVNTPGGVAKVPAGITPDAVKKWLLANKQANPNIPYYDLWGQLADAMKADGLNPSNYDQYFWEILSPEGLAGYQKYVKGKGVDAISNPFG